MLEIFDYYILIINDFKNDEFESFLVNIGFIPDDIVGYVYKSDEFYIKDTIGKIKYFINEYNMLNKDKLDISKIYILKNDNYNRYEIVKIKD